MTYGTVNTDIVADSSGGRLAPISSVFRNRIINGAMMIDQRNAGSQITPVQSSFGVDRFIFQVSQASKFTSQQNAGSVTPPVGFSNYLGCTSSSAYSVASDDYFLLEQYVEGFNTSDLAFGTANASTVTLSFWVRSSLTGTFGGALGNNASSRSYPFSYTISAANTWEQKSITIAGDTTGTWVGATNGVGLRVRFSLGMGSNYSGTAGAWAAGFQGSATGATSVVGTNGATFYITGVQLEVGSSATGFEYVNYQTSLANCQRYYETPFQVVAAGGNHALNTYGSNALGTLQFKVSKRAEPTISLFNTSSGSISAGGTSYAPYNYAYLYLAGSTTGYAGWSASAEL